VVLGDPQLSPTVARQRIYPYYCPGVNRSPEDLSLVLSSGYAVREATGNSLA
jgi:hypothetical protein